MKLFWDCIYSDRRENDEAMEGIQLKLAGNGRGAFVYEEGDEQLAEMEIAISGKNLIVYHTEVAP